ncbi:MAG: helix-turn-helix domain containing protein [Novosphingobium sp.]|nr:helix-turn-helix domain containing protein [Novosphingobium sp.]
MDHAVRAGKVGRPRAGDSAAITTRILHRAWMLYVKGGYTAVTFDALSSQERMSKHTIYARFEDKAALVRAMAEWRLESWFGENPVALNPAYADPLCSFIDLSMRVTLSPDARAMSRILRGEDETLADLRPLILAFYTRALMRLAGIIAQLPDRGSSPVNPQDAAKALTDMLMGHANILYGDLPRGAECEAYLADATPRMIRLANRLIGRPPATGLAPNR